jgi:hypothetical protein
MRGSRQFDIKRVVQSLEDACQRRDRARLLEDIPVLLEVARGSWQVRLRALDWYWRAGLHLEGVRCALIRPDSGKLVSTQAELLQLPEEQLLWASRFLISVGAWPFGRSLIEPLRIRSSRGRILLAMDYFALGNHDQVIANLEKVARPQSQEVRWHIITTFARSWLELGDAKRALQWAERGLELIHTEPDRWVLESLRARAIALSGKVAKGLEEFLAAEKKRSNLAVFAPHWFGYSRIWKGTLLALNGKSRDARAAFDEGLIHYKTGMQDLQPWRSLLVQDAMKTAGLLTAEEARAFDCYPLKPPLCRNQGFGVWSPSTPRFHFRLSADEWMRDDQWQLGIPLEWRMAAGLALAGDLGVHQNLLKCWLWPDSLALFFQLDGRLNQLVHRLRHEHSFQIIRERECLSLGASDRGQLAVDPRAGQRPTWLESQKNQAFTAQELAHAFGLSARMSQVVLLEWMSRGWVLKFGAGRATRYQVGSVVAP